MGDRDDDEKPEDLDRAAILARRNRFITMALTGLTAGAIACDDTSSPDACLKVADPAQVEKEDPKEPAAQGEEGETPTAASGGGAEGADAEGADAEGGEAEGGKEPMPTACLRVAAPPDPKPQPCLDVAPEPEPEPQACLKVAAPDPEPVPEKPKPQPCLKVKRPD